MHAHIICNIYNDFNGINLSNSDFYLQCKESSYNKASVLPSSASVYENTRSKKYK